MGDSETGAVSVDRHLPRRRGSVAVLVALLAFAATATCRVDDLAGPSHDPALTIDLGGGIVAVGDSLPLSAVLRVDGQPAEAPLVWTIAAGEIASITPDGLVHGVRRGKVAVTARLAAGTLERVAVAEDTVWVTARALTLGPVDTTLTSVLDTVCFRVGALDAAGLPIGGAVPALRVASDPDSALALVGTGCAVARGPGTATVVAELDTASAVASVSVVQLPAALVVAPGDRQFGRLGDTATFAVTAVDGRGNAAPVGSVAWTSADPAVASVSALGLVTATAAGSSFVVADAGGVVDSAAVTVAPPVLSLSPPALATQAAEGSAALRTVTLQIANGGTGTLDWTVTTGATWLTPSSTSGSGPASVIFTFDPAGLSAGAVNELVVVDAVGAAGAPDTLVATFTIGACSATPLTPDTTFAFALSGADCGAPHRPGAFARVFTVSATDDDTLTLSLEGSVDAYLTVADPFGAEIASNDECLGNAAPGRACLRELRVAVAGAYRIEATTQAAQTTGDLMLSVIRPVPPAGPTAVAQLESDRATPVAIGGTIDTTSAFFRATLIDPNPDDSVALQVELRPVGTAFTGAPTGTGSFVAPGAAAGVAVDGLSDDEAYHWRLRAVDYTGRVGPWLTFGGNAESEPDLLVAVPDVPSAPAGLDQRTADGSGAIAVGGVAAERDLSFGAIVTDPDPGDQLRLDVEVLPVGSPFTGAPTATGSVAVGSGGTAQVVVSGLADDTEHHWRARVRDQNDLVGPWTAFGGNLESDPDFRTDIPDDPAAPGALAQRQTDDTPIAPGGGTTETAVVFGALVSDPDVGAMLRLQVEAQPVGTPFAGVPAGTGVPVASGGTAQVTLPGMSDNTAYQWQARVIDETDRTGPWVAFGDGSGDYVIAIPEDPSAPSAPGQFKSDGVTAVGVGNGTDESTVVFAATVSDPDLGDVLRLQVERQPTGTPFTDVPTATGAAAVPSGDIATVTILGHADNTGYHWQARAIDQDDRTGPWSAFGGNPESDADFRIAIPEDPGTPLASAQYASDGLTSIAVGDSTDIGTIVFRATVTDPDAGDLLRLQVEVRPVGVAFTGVVSGTSATAVASGAQATVAVSGQADNTSYHWRSRTIDQTNRTSAWDAFGANAETATDYRIAVPEAPAVASGLEQLKSDGLTILAVGDTTGETTVLLRGFVTDPDPGDQLILEVEVRDVGTPFSDVATQTSPAGASGNTLSATVSGLAEDTPYHWQARVCDQTAQCSAWTAFGGNAPGEPDIIVAVPETPAAPVASAQLASDSVSGIAVGATTDERSVVFQATVSDPDPGDQLRLQVEVQPLGTPFGGTVSASSLDAVGSGGAASAALAGQDDNTSYHWRARTVDQTGRTSGWVVFGGNGEIDIDYRIEAPDAPGAPSGTGQFKSNQTTSIAVGGTTDETSVVVKAVVTDPDAGDQVGLEIEVRPLGNPFTNTATAAGTAVASGGTAVVTATSLTEDVSYHWQVRACDLGGLCSAWAPFGGNAESAADVTVAVPESPAAPSALGQFAADSVTALAVGAVTDETVVVFQAVVTDPDPADQLRLEVEIQPIGAAFIDAPTVTGTAAVGVGGVATVAVPGLSDDQAYHWQARAVDQTDATGGWTAFGGNLESDADVAVAVPEAPGAPAGAAQFKSDGTTGIGVGVATDESTVVFKATVTDPDPGAQLRIQVEAQPLGTPFTGTPTVTSAATVTSGTIASATLPGQTDDRDYHWRVRTIDETSRTSAWVPFGGNTENDVDYRVATAEPPGAPTALAQFKSNGSTPISPGGNSGGLTVVLAGSVTDPDPGDQLTLEVEARAIATPFSNTATSTGAVAVASGQVATSSATVVLASYHWQARTCDQTGLCSAWVEFGANPADIDFVATLF